MATPGGWVTVARSWFEGSNQNLSAFQRELFLYLIVHAEFKDGRQVSPGAPRELSLSSAPSSAPSSRAPELSSELENATNVADDATLSPSPIILKRGQFYTTLSHLAEVFKKLYGADINRFVVRKAIDALTRAQKVAQTGYNKGSVITIINYDKYQHNIIPQSGTQKGGAAQVSARSANHTFIIFNKQINKRALVFGGEDVATWEWLKTECHLQHLPAELVSYLEDNFAAVDIAKLIELFTRARVTKQIALSRCEWIFNRMMKNHSVSEVRAAMKTHFGRRHDDEPGKYGERYFDGILRGNRTKQKITRPDSAREEREDWVFKDGRIPDLDEFFSSRDPKAII